MNNIGRTFYAKDYKIEVLSGEVKCCSNGQMDFYPGSKKFYDILEKAMNEMYSNATSEFENLYKNLNFCTREFKIAKRIYGPIIPSKPKDK